MRYFSCTLLQHDAHFFLIIELFGIVSSLSTLCTWSWLETAVSESYASVMHLLLFFHYGLSWCPTLFSLFSSSTGIKIETGCCGGKAKTKEVEFISQLRAAGHKYIFGYISQTAVYFVYKSNMYIARIWIYMELKWLRSQPAGINAVRKHYIKVGYSCEEVYNTPTSSVF